MQMYLNNPNTTQGGFPVWANVTPDYTFLVPYLDAVAMPDLWSYNVGWLSSFSGHIHLVKAYASIPMYNGRPVHFCVLCSFQALKTGQHCCSAMSLPQAPTTTPFM